VNFQVFDSYDRARWDGFVSTLGAGHFMQSYAWGELQRRQGWTPRYGVLEETGSIRAAILLLERGAPGLRRATRMYFAPRGPAVEPSDLTGTDALLSEVARYVRSSGAVFMRCEPYWTEAQAFGGRGSPPAVLKRVPRDWSYWNAPRFVFWLDLTGDEAALMSRLTPGCRKDVRRGYRDVTFQAGSESDIPEFYRLMTLTGHQKGIAYHDLEYYRELCRVLGDSVKVQLFFGRLGNEAITTGMSIAYGRKAWLMYAASDPAHYKLRANRAQQWEMLKWAQSLGCERYDFRGTSTGDPPDPADPGYGVYEFKKSFGPEFTRLAGYFDLVQRPIRYRMFRIAEEHVLPAAYKIRMWLKA
jgi:lipid II:glycine glycyltransferase (peptidoglycan interpeptide bridge formation enzyme)